MKRKRRRAKEEDKKEVEKVGIWKKSRRRNGNSFV